MKTQPMEGNFAATYKDSRAHLKAQYERYLLEGYTGIPWMEFVVLTWVGMKGKDIYNVDRVTIMTYINHIKTLTLFTEDQRAKAKDVKTENWKLDYCIANIMTNRIMIKNYRAAIRKIVNSY